ncbi:MAG: imidazole glycerol phosphate synthase subunit HisF, partial [Anaerolineae bacterium]
CIVVAIDAKRTQQRREERGERRDPSSNLSPLPSPLPPLHWEVYTHGGRKPRGLDAVEWAREVEARGAGEILLTSMDADGTQDGYDIALTRAVAEAVSIPVIASGGAGRLEHFHEVLTKGQADAALAASLFHYRKLSIGQVKAYLREKGVLVRR